MTNAQFKDNASVNNKPSLMSKSLAASSDPLASNSSSPFSVIIIVLSSMSTKQPTTSPLCHERPSGSAPWWYHWAWTHHKNNKVRKGAKSKMSQSSICPFNYERKKLVVYSFRKGMVWGHLFPLCNQGQAINGWLTFKKHHFQRKHKLCRIQNRLTYRSLVFSCLWGQSNEKTMSWEWSWLVNGTSKTTVSSQKQHHLFSLQIKNTSNLFLRL